MRYRKEGLAKTTRQLIAAISRQGMEGMTLLDIGGGLGGIQHTMLAKGVVQATYVDASSAYIKAAREEAKRRDQDGRITFLHGDYVDLAEEIPPADIVTLDRVVCCYDDMQALVKFSAMKARKFYGMVYPRDLWLFRTLMPVVNFFIALTGSPFRSFIHSTEQIEKILKDQGLVPQFQKNAGFWQIMVYNRT
jgi:magnesium-protoporphyrin O-methyltransferase